ncbi:ABC transporter substrate-binding protein [Mesorhizobium sp. Cs1299R1N3]|uniref:ABC transporter substrate-binding protein n=1 Tax=Mesorhizobium sp. Cs1299R1N3 TaxID=3015173 RepID=UPI00301BAAED
MRAKLNVTSAAIGGLLALSSILYAYGAAAADKIRMSTRASDWDLVLIESGVAANYGLELEDVPMKAGTDVAEALIGGSIDIASVGETPLTSLLTKSDAVGVVGTAVRTDGSYVKALVPMDSPYKTLMDLKGKKIATNIGAGSYRAFANWCEKNGLSINDFQILNTPPTAILAALEAKAVDAAIWFAPTTTIAVQNGLVKVIGDFKGLADGQASWVVNREFAKANPDVVTRFVAATIEAQNILVKDPAQAAKLIEQGMQRRGRIISAEQIQPGFVDFDYSPEFDPKKSVAVFQVVFKGLAAEGKLSGEMPDFDKDMMPQFHADAEKLVDQKK